MIWKDWYRTLQQKLPFLDKIRHRHLLQMSKSAFFSVNGTFRVLDLINHFNHSLSVYATTMVSKKLSNHW